MDLGPENPYVGGFPATSFGECGNHPAYQAGGEFPFASMEVFCDANHRISYKGYSGEACSGDMTHATVEMVYNHPSGECGMEESEECGGHDASGHECPESRDNSFVHKHMCEEEGFTGLCPAGVTANYWEEKGNTCSDFCSDIFGTTCSGAFELDNNHCGSNLVKELGCEDDIMDAEVHPWHVVCDCGEHDDDHHGDGDHDPSKCREHREDQLDSDCCGYSHETWCADGYTKVTRPDGVVV
jgi:hypothetical protein